MREPQHRGGCAARLLPIPTGSTAFQAGPRLGRASRPAPACPAQIIHPKSPLEDGLAALHEIATSPNPFAFLLGAGGKARPQIILPAEDADAPGECAELEGAEMPLSSCQPARFVAFAQPTPSGRQLVYLSADPGAAGPTAAEGGTGGPPEPSPFPGYSRAAAHMWAGHGSPCPEYLGESLATPAALYAAMGLGSDHGDAALPAARSAMHSLDGSGSAGAVVPQPPSPRAAQQQGLRAGRQQAAGQLPRRAQQSPRGGGGGGAGAGYKGSSMVPVQPAMPLPHLLHHPHMQPHHHLPGPPYGAHNPLQLAFILPPQLHHALAGATFLPPGHPLAPHHAAGGYRPGAMAIQLQAALQRAAGLGVLQARAEALEASQGRHHPDVFKHWLLASQAYQSLAEARLAEQCVQRAKACWDACLRRSGKAACGSAAEAEFSYLLVRLRGLDAGAPGA